ncbi:hypothetical protein SAMN05216418_0411 [Microbacterium enclense]|uniref:Uncharacterized protein n=2 Tax=Microbacterium enclense TaxID=993073 RepID=A0A1G6GLS6_9MICO|nr:hypothetical protein AS029_00875 [Microbacterium enclense]SDB82920.1 hypothetical protein SAMN05216418_0411 [Microbacterium enclense]
MLTEDPEPVLRDLRVAAGDNTALLARLCGQVAGFFMSAKTAVMCSAIVEHIDGAAEWAEIGRQRRLLAVDHDGEFESSPEANF